MNYKDWDLQRSTKGWELDGDLDSHFYGVQLLSRLNEDSFDAN